LPKEMSAAVTKVRQPGSGPRQAAQIVSAARENPLGFAGWVFISALGTNVKSAFDTAMNIIEAKNAPLLLIAATSVKVPRGIILLDDNDYFFIKEQKHTVLMLESSRPGIPDQINYKALRMVGFILCMMARMVNNEYANMYLEAHGNPMDMRSIEIEEDNTDEAKSINAELQKLLPLTDRQRLVDDLNETTQDQRMFVHTVMNAAPALHAHFTQYIGGAKDFIALSNASGKPELYSEDGADKMRRFIGKGTFSAADFANSSNHYKPAVGAIALPTVEDNDARLGGVPVLGTATVTSEGLTSGRKGKKDKTRE
jgi:hypothetical protein